MLAMVTLFVTAAFQIAMPSSVELPQDTAVAARRPPPLGAPVARSYPAVLARPIFAPDRAPVILQAPSGGNLAGFEVVGTAIAGTISAALVRDATGRIIRVKPEDVVQGWRLVLVERTQLTFDRDGERRSLAVTAAPPPTGVNPQLATSGAGSKEDDDDDDSSSSSSDDDDDE